MAFRVVQSITRGSKAKLFQTRFYTVYPSYLFNTPITKVTTLPSGLRIASADGLGELTSIGVWVDEAGSAYESEDKNGVANLLQNLIWRGNPNRTRSQLENEIASIGGCITGYTDRERSAFIANVHKNDIRKSVEILSDLVQNPNYDEAELEKIRSAILIEQDSLKTKWDQQVLIDHAHSAAYQGTPMSMVPIGETSTLKNIQVLDLHKFAQTYYTAPNIMLVGTGAINHEELVSLAIKLFDGLPTNGTPPMGFVDFIGSEIRIRDDTEHEARCIYSYEAVGRSHPHYWSFLLLKTIIGSWSRYSGEGIYQSSRWAEILSVEKLAYEYSAFYNAYNTTGLFGVYAVTVHDKIDDMTYEIFNEFQKIATYMTEVEFTGAKNQLKAELLSKYDNLNVVAEDIAVNLSANRRVLSLIEQFKRIDNIQISDLVACVETYLTDVDPVVVGFGQIEALPDYNIMRSWTYWNRW